MEYTWEKPVIVFYKERHEKPQRRAFAVIKAAKLIINKEDTELTGTIKDFFPYMGNIDYINTKAGLADNYVLCWMDDEEDDFAKAWKRLTSVTFPNRLTHTTDKKGKETYNTTFKAKHGKLK